MYTIKYWYEHGGGCLWSADEITVSKFGNLIDYHLLDLSASTIESISMLETQYATYLDWNNPAAPSTWSREKKNKFLTEATKTYYKIVEDLGETYTVINMLYLSIPS